MLKIKPQHGNTKTQKDNWTGKHHRTEHKGQK